MSASKIQETEELVIKLLRKLERKGKNMQLFLWKLMDQFEDEQCDEKNDDNKSNVTNDKISLLYDPNNECVCKVGHYINKSAQKHLSIGACIICGHRNNNQQNQVKPQNRTILQFLNTYDRNQIPFGPHQNQTGEIKDWVSKGFDKSYPLHYAAITGDIVNIKQLCQNRNINMYQKMTYYDDTIPITEASRYGQLHSVIELIKKGSNPMPPPDNGSATPYKHAVLFKHKSLLVFYQKYTKYMHNFAIDENTNLECYKCYIYDLHFNKHLINGTMANYIYCRKCTAENVKKVQKKQTDNLIIESRIIKTLKQNASISVDTLCQMKDVKSLHSILKQIMVSGATFAYSLWLLDIDNFKSINTHLTHAVADTKIQALGQVLKKLEPITRKQWIQRGYDGINKVWAFRQGGDEFALIVSCNYQKKNILQKLYDVLRNDINKIKLENMKTMKHITVSIGVCLGYKIDNYEQMMKKADTAAETVKNNGKNDIAIYAGWKAQNIYNKFNEI